MDIVKMVLDFVVGLLGPNAVDVLAIIGLCRLVFKSIRMAVENFIKETPSTKDDEKYEEIKKSAVFVWIEKILELFTSIKLPGAK